MAISLMNMVECEHQREIYGIFKAFAENLLYVNKANCHTTLEKSHRTVGEKDDFTYS